jgi:SAM-dependent methyltransferase
LSIFGTYSRYYNLLYKDKNYTGETDYVHHLIKKYQPNAKNILDLGCGTGRHDILLAQRGYEITGVDMSEEMLAVANSQLLSINPKPSYINFIRDDIRAVRLSTTFDVVISLFHVMSYQTTNNDLTAAFATARAHLKEKGIFIFDCWYGPAVLTDRPAVRVKRLEDEEVHVTRIAEPVMHPNQNLVDVNYHVFVKEKASGKVEELKETHRMRYLFLPEIDLLLRKTGMEIIESSEWMTGREPGFDTWGVCFVVRG